MVPKQGPVFTLRPQRNGLLARVIGNIRLHGTEMNIATTTYGNTQQERSSALLGACTAEPSIGSSFSPSTLLYVLTMYSETVQTLGDQANIQRQAQNPEHRECHKFLYLMKP